MTRPAQMTPDAEALIRRLRVAICCLKLNQFHIEEVETYFRHGRTLISFADLQAYLDSLPECRMVA